MKEHTKNASPSNWDKHTSHSNPNDQKKKQDSNWVDQGKNQGSDRNKNRDK